MGPFFIRRLTNELYETLTLPIVFVFHYLTFKRIDEAALIMATLPFALAGGIRLL